MDLFRDHFKNYADRYVLIGGTACSIAFEDFGIEFRATKDLDIVIFVEALDGEFVKVFWDFIQKGGYKNQQKSTGKKLFYRFDKPEDNSFPFMLELFSRVPDVLNLGKNSHLTPIPVDDEISSLSAILLNDDYYRFIQEGKQEVDGLPIVKPEYLIPLKTKAWLDLIGRRETGEKVNEKDIRKHRNDVFRLYQAIPPNIRVITPVSIKNDLTLFIKNIKEDASLDLEGHKPGKTNINQIADNLRAIYGLEA